jgi:hypothetical protein
MRSKDGKGQVCYFLSLNSLLFNEFYIIEISLERLRKEYTRILTNTMKPFWIKRFHVDSNNSINQ